MASYKLSNEAASDIESILEFGIDTFGLDQALLYHTSLEARFSELADFPFHYPAVDHIRRGYRMSVYGSHSIYYQIKEDHIPKRIQDAGFNRSKLSLILLTKESAISGKVSSKN